MFYGTSPSHWLRLRYVVTDHLDLTILDSINDYYRSALALMSGRLDFTRVAVIIMALNSAQLATQMFTRSI